MDKVAYDSLGRRHVALPDVHGDAVAPAQVVDERPVDRQPFPPAGVRVDLELERMLLAFGTRGLVVDDREPLGAVRFVDDHVGAADYDRLAEMEFEGPLDGPDVLQVVAPLV